MLPEWFRRVLKPVISRLEFPQHPRPPQRELRNRGVFDSGGGLIGHVANVYVDDDRRFRFVQVAMSGFMGLGKKHHLVPVKALVEVEPGSITLGLDRRTIESAPTLGELRAAPDATVYARVATMRVLEGQFDAMLRFIEEVARPTAGRQEEFGGGFAMGDRSAKEIVTVSWWNSEESLQASGRCEHFPEHPYLPAQFAISLAELPETEHYQLDTLTLS
jgi:hypothetical protein